MGGNLSILTRRLHYTRNRHKAYVSLEQVVENILAKASGSWVINKVLMNASQINVEEIYNFIWFKVIWFLFLKNQSSELLYWQFWLANNGKNRLSAWPPHDENGTPSIGRLCGKSWWFLILCQSRNVILSRVCQLWDVYSWDLIESRPC